ncbi:coproporphyrinogen III oxidase [Boletus reticuloceps]|uniref:coproporphyrinogen oxidase n=1 Tax=Boletus reticuloceps TaxID=495285 RepID=A0A8I3AB04_9AGAM|nr:coproporphyrinogen III oxidase [Boletus reticuloceps]
MTVASSDSESQPMRERVVDLITQLQDDIVTKLESYGSERFRRESWTRDEGGGGLSCTFPPSPASTDDDHPIEKAGVNISTINGVLPPAAIKQMSTAHAALKDIHTSHPFAAAGLSLIIHSRHPRVPAVHANYRYFEVLDGPRDDGQDQGTTPTVLAWWFGVITDLTPAYVNASDFGHFHNTLKTACDTWISSSSPVAVSVYPAFKTSCDDYLYIPHRHEHRGIGGVRFDDMGTDAMQALLARVGDAGDTHLSEDTIVRLSSQQALFSLVEALGDSFLPSFTPMLERQLDVPFVPSERRWQLLRRGRAVEFNLVVDRGTKFGLAAPGIRPENILVGMPPEARWEYCSELGQEDQDTEEAEMVKILKQPRSWVD